MTIEKNMLKNMRVLYVEDDADIRQLMVKKLSRVVGEVLEAGNGQQGLELYRQQLPDLVVSDVQMPEMNGLDLTAAIKAINSNTPVILATASNEIDHLLQAIATGVDGYVIKPIRTELLIETLNRCASTLYYQREVARKNQELLTLYESDMDDLAVANTIMEHIMRSDGLRDPQIRFFQRPARHFSGDIIAAARDEQGDLHILLADVTGHGLQAALFLLPINRVFYDMVKRGGTTAEIAMEMNQTMRDIALTERFIAAAIVHITHDASTIEIWNGGIPAAVYLQQDGGLHKFPSRHLPLGVVGASAFDAETELYQAPPGTLFLCTDGLTEAENAAGELFSNERVERILLSASPDTVFDDINSSLEAHLQGGVAHDDLSIVLVRCGI